MRNFLTALLIPLLTTFGLTSCARSSDNTLAQSATFKSMNEADPQKANTPAGMQTATFGAGCFWCTEAQFQQLEGVTKVESGYEGGTIANPTYEEVCTGNTGHAEVTRITYDPAKISYKELLAAFWQTHDPTQLNRQGGDVGTQYRSVIFYNTPEEKKEAEFYKNQLNQEKAYTHPVVTEISKTSTFYKAEDYHQDYYNQNGGQPYCSRVIQPKLEKFKKVFADKLKK